MAKRKLKVPRKRKEWKDLAMCLRQGDNHRLAFRKSFPGRGVAPPKNEILNKLWAYGLITDTERKRFMITLEDKHGTYRDDSKTNNAAIKIKHGENIGYGIICPKEEDEA